MSPYLEASLATLEELLESLARFVGPLDDSELNWTPLDEGTNSIAALVTHTVGSTVSLLARATGETPKRDRDAEFLARGAADELVGLIEGCREEARRRLAQLDSLDPTARVTIHRARTGGDLEVTAAWCVEHALVHAGEHWGHIQLTSQLYRAYETMK